MLPKMRGFKIASLNITSLLKHIDELTIIMNNRELDVLAINETRLDPSVSLDLIRIQGYNWVSKDRNRVGGGIGFYIRDTINFRVRTDLNKDIEILTIEINKNKVKPFLITTWYRPPNSPIETLHIFEEALQLIDTDDKESILLGDINCDLLINNSSQSVIKELNFITNLYQYKQLIHEPTRVSQHSETLIDHFYTTHADNIVKSGVSKITISDHFLIYGIRKFPSFKEQSEILEFRDFKNFNEESFRLDLASLSNLSLDHYNDPNRSWLMWKHKFLEIVNKHAPLKKRKIKKKRTPWITSDLIAMKRQKNFLKRKAINSKCPNDWTAYKITRNNYNRLIKGTIGSYYQKKLDDNQGNIKRTWDTINQLINRSSKCNKINEIINSNNDVVNDEHLPDVFNKHFIDLGQTLSQKIPASNIDPGNYLKVHNSPNFEFKEVSNTEVLKLLLQLSISKATGLDGLSTRIIKIAAPIIVTNLTIIFNQSISTGIFPNEWKVTRVIPIFKDGTKNDMNNYRPISIISVIAKVMERLVHGQLYSYLIETDLLSDSQHGFRPLHSTLTALLEITNKWGECIDSGELNGVIFLDLKKAFDTVDHHILFTKIKLYGITGLAYDWFVSYLSNRTQYCMVNGRLSQPLTVKTGIPQGSVLGPLLFIIYVNDLPNCLESTRCNLFADDTQISASATSIIEIEQTLNEDLKKISDWMIANKLSLNVGKTEYMIIGSRQRLSQVQYQPKISIGELEIRRVKSTKSLGLIIDETLTWSEQVDHITKKVITGLGILRRIRDFVPHNTLLTVYWSLIQPYFDYCSPVWAGLGKTLSLKLQKLQNRAARIINRDSYDISSSDCLSKLNLSNLETRRDQQISTVMYKVSHNQVPDHLGKLFRRTCQQHSFNTRQAEYDFVPPKPNTNYLKNTFSYRGSVVWNKLPVELKSSTSLNIFKTRIRNYNCNNNNNINNIINSNNSI